MNRERLSIKLGSDFVPLSFSRSSEPRSGDGLAQASHHSAVWTNRNTWKYLETLFATVQDCGSLLTFCRQLAGGKITYQISRVFPRARQLSLLIR